jgi:tetratricopeptide (TPR) repeat protein
MWIGNNPTSTGYPKMPPGIRATQEGLLRDSITLAEKANGHPMKRWEVAKYWKGRANEYIHSHFSAWLRLVGVKFKNFWNAYQYDDLSIIKLLRDDGVLPPGLKFGIVGALGLAGFIPVLIRYRRSGWVVAAVLLHMCALLPAFVTERYRLAAVPGLIILSVAGLWVFWENFTRSRWIQAGAYLLLCAVAAWFVSIPQPDIGLWSLDFYKAGIRANSASDLELRRQNPAGAREAIDRAQRNLEIAYSYVPNNEDIDFALGNVWLTRANFPWTDPKTKAADQDIARTCYGEALRLNPHHPGTLNNWGVLEMEAKHWDQAEKYFLEAARAEPDDAKAYYLIALVRKEMGKIEGAKSALGQALKRRPNQKEFLDLQQQLEASAPTTAPAPAREPEAVTPPASSPQPPPPPGPAAQ